MIDATPQDITPQDVSVRALEAAMFAMPEHVDLERLTAHHFCEGLYARELFIPAGTVVVGKRHARQNFFLLVAGELAMATKDGPKVIRAPFMVVTQPGDKRAVVAITDCTCLNIHSNPDDERDLVALEAKYITPEALPAPDAKELLL